MQAEYRNRVMANRGIHSQTTKDQIDNVFLEGSVDFMRLMVTTKYIGFTLANDIVNTLNHHNQNEITSYIIDEKPKTKYIKLKLLYLQTYQEAQDGRSNLNVEQR